MDALRFTAKTKKLELVKIPVPEVTEPDQVLIQVSYSGICGTDLHIIQGEFPCNPHRQVTLGHEFSGTVIQVGAGVVNFKKGDRVSIDPNSGCRCCLSCHQGSPHLCKAGGINTTVGIHRDGGWAKFVVVPEEQIHKLTDTVTLEQAALCEPLSCLAHGWDIISPVHVGQKILVTGAGIIGNLWISILHLQGHRNVTVSEPNQIRLDMVKRLNTGFTLLTPDQLKKNQAADPNYLFDLVIDCSGFPPAIEHAVSILRGGGKLCIFGVAPPQGRISLSPFDIYIKELKIFGVFINPYTFPKSLGLVEAMGDRYLNYQNLGVQTFALSEYKDAMELLKKGTISKAVFKL